MAAVTSIIALIIILIIVIVIVIVIVIINVHVWLTLSSKLILKIDLYTLQDDVKSRFSGHFVHCFQKQGKLGSKLHMSQASGEGKYEKSHEAEK